MPRAAALRLKAAADALRAGSGATALRHASRLLISDPRHVNALILAAMAERQCGAHGAAARLFRLALALQPGNPHASAGFAEYATAASEPGADASELLAAARRDPASVRRWLGLGWAAMSRGMAQTAWAALRRACVLSPGERSAVSLAILAERRRSGRVDWRALAGRALAVGPASSSTLEAALIAAHQARDGALTLRIARRVAVLAPNSEGAYQGVALMADVVLRSRLRPFAARLAAWAEAMSPASHAHAAVRARLLRVDGRLADATRYLRACIVERPGDATSTTLGFDLVSILDQSGDTAAAAAALVLANRTARHWAAAEASDRRRFIRSLDRFIPPARVAPMAAVPSAAVPSAAVPSATAPTAAMPVFLFGMPRSGNTLIGDMLHRHRSVETLDERELLPDTVQTASTRLRERGIDPVDVIARRHRVGEADLEAMRTVFHKVVRLRSTEPDRPVKVDKSPFGLLYAGLVDLLFPGAPIVFALRHPADVCLSCLMQGFASTDALVSFNSVVETVDLYDRVMTFWTRVQELLPLNVHTVRYEALVVDPTVESRRLTDFLGLDWSPELLDPGRTAGRYTATPSFRQVARPIGREAIGRWKHYRDYLEPGWPTLLPWIRRLGYEEA